MKQIKHLFRFTLTKAAICQHLNGWMLATKTDFFYDGQQMYADIYGAGEYYAIVTKPVDANTYDVFADLELSKHVSFIQKLFPVFSKKKSVQTINSDTRLIYATLDNTAKVPA